MLQGDQSLDGIAAVVLDEFHERSLDADVGLTLCLDVQRALRPDLRSSRCPRRSTAPQSRQVLGEHACVVRLPDAPSRSEVVWLHPPRGASTLTRGRGRGRRHTLRESSRDVFAFLPGAVRSVPRSARSRHRRRRCYRCTARCRVLEQDRLGPPRRSPQGRAVDVYRRDEPHDRGHRCGPSTRAGAGCPLRPTPGHERTRDDAGSQASAGPAPRRAGRTAAGHVHRLWSEARRRELAPFDPTRDPGRRTSRRSRSI